MSKTIKVHIPCYIESSETGRCFIITNKFSIIYLKLKYNSEYKIYFKNGFIHIECALNNLSDAKRIIGIVKSFIQSKVYKVPVKFVGVGYKALLYDENILKVYLGFSHSLQFKVPEGILVVVSREGTSLCVYGMNKGSVIEWVSYLKSFKKPSKYNNKGIHVVS